MDLIMLLSFECLCGQARFRIGNYFRNLPDWVYCGSDFFYFCRGIMESLRI